jgi:serine/threonine-protein kinase RsbW
LVCAIKARRDDVHRDHHGRPPAADVNQVNTDGQPFRWQGPAIAARLGEVRRAVQSWAEHAGLPVDLIEQLALAGYEAMANVVEHAYAGVAPGLLSVQVSASPGLVDVLVEDQGKWRVPDIGTGFRGRGLLLIKGLADEVTVTATEHGTAVRMHWSHG